MSDALRSCEIINRLGIHARAAAALVKLAERFEADVVLEKDGQRARATSVLELLMLCGQVGSTVTVSATGPDAEEAVDAVDALIKDRFGEGE